MILGVKASPSDVPAMSRLEQVEFIETVLWGEDLTKRYDETRDAFSSYDVRVVHVPFTVPGGLEVDVAHEDAAHREASLRMWRASLRLADDLGARWVVVHPGGIVPRAAASGSQGGALRAWALERTEKALQALVDQGAGERVLVENMPAHYHRAKGTTDVMLTGLGVLDFLGWMDHAAGVCLDVSHAMLTPGGQTTLETFLRRGAKWLRHLHLGDAVPPDQEGVPLGRGVVDWDRFKVLVADVEARVGELGAVPEVHRGHLDAGKGFQDALAFARSRF